MAAKTSPNPISRSERVWDEARSSNMTSLEEIFEHFRTFICRWAVKITYYIPCNYWVEKKTGILISWHPWSLSPKQQLLNISFLTSKNRWMWRWVTKLLSDAFVFARCVRCHFLPALVRYAHHSFAPSCPQRKMMSCLQNHGNIFDSFCFLEICCFYLPRDAIILQIPWKQCANDIVKLESK